MDRDEMRKVLLGVAAHLVRGDNLPPSEISDWDLPKSFPRRSRAYIEEEMKRSRRSGIHLAKQLVKVADAMKGGDMRVLVACECSGVVRRAFRDRGHDAWSCDLMPAEDESPFHYQRNLAPLCEGDWLLSERWDLVIAHPPCDHLAVSGARWFAEKRRDGRQKQGIDFFMLFTQLHHIERVCIENPVSIMSTVWRKPDQIVQPWMFGHGETKATCLWLKGLPKLTPTNIVEGREAKVHRMAPGPNRAKDRSRTYEGLGRAMAEQWG